MPKSEWRPDLTSREFRVKSVRRFIVTDWEDYRNGRDGAGVREIAICDKVEQANEIAEAFGRVYPGSLVNPMDTAQLDLVDNAYAIYYLNRDQAERLDMLLGAYGGAIAAMNPETSSMLPGMAIDAALTALPYAAAAYLRRIAQGMPGDLLDRLNRLQIAVDAS